MAFLQAVSSPNICYFIPILLLVLAMIHIPPPPKKKKFNKANCAFCHSPCIYPGVGSLFAAVDG